MWNKMTIRTKITLLTVLILILVSVCITGLSILNAKQNFVMPFGYIRIPPDSSIEFQVDEKSFENKSPDELSEDADIMDIRHMIQQSQSSFKIQSLAIAVIFICIGTIGVYFISGRVLKPITVLTTRIKDIDENNLKTQIEPCIVEDEVAQLTNSFNHMLDKLNHSFENQRLFAQNAAHELKTPLSSIMAHIDVLQMDEQPTNDDYRETIEVVRISTKRLIDLVSGLLSLNSLMDEHNCEFIDCRKMFENIMTDMQEMIDEKRLHFAIFGDCQIIGDKNLLERAFANLVSNAVRYNVEEGTVQITLGVSNIVIEDSGIGIPEENLDLIFEPFYCVDKSYSKKILGNGLGMAIAKNIFDKHNIKIKITSNLGQGTKIILEY
jgi:Signal transduction histidine kinase